MQQKTLFSVPDLPESVLREIPDFSDWKKAESWIRDATEAAKGVQDSPFLQYWKWEGASTVQERGIFGPYPSQNWQKLVTATFVADLASYPSPPDQVTFDHLLLGISAFPRGFRVWFAQTDVAILPVGYSAWHPVAEETYSLFTTRPTAFDHRLVPPRTEFQNGSPCIYLFNYSVVSGLRGSSLARALIKAYADELDATRAKQLCTITVSEDGQRVASRFGMAPSPLDPSFFTR